MHSYPYLYDLHRSGEYLSLSSVSFILSAVSTTNNGMNSTLGGKYRLGFEEELAIDGYGLTLRSFLFCFILILRNLP